jgi:hypothetical protein
MPYAPPIVPPSALYLLPGMPVTPWADKISHGLCLFLFLRYLYTFTMIHVLFFALLAPDHELPSIWLPTNTIKLISITPLIFDAPLLLGITCPLNDLLTQFLVPFGTSGLMRPFCRTTFNGRYRQKKVYAFIQNKWKEKTNQTDKA